MKELKIWWIYTKNSFQQILSRRFIAVIFVFGKAARISMFLFFLNALFRGADGIAGYSREQIIFFYLSFNLIDTLGQLFFREVYRFRQLVVSGGLDFVLVKPVNPLLRVLLGGADVLDAVVLVVLMGFTIWYGATNISTDIASWGGYFLLVLNGLLISAAFHLGVISLGVITTTVDHLIMIYRDLSSMMRIPVDLYIEPIRFLLTFAIPVGIMLTFPPKVLMGLISPGLIVISFSLSLVSILVGMKFWQYALKQYQSASS